MHRTAIFRWHPIRYPELRHAEGANVANSVLIHIRVDVEVKTQATEVLSAMGLSISDAVRMLLKRVTRDKVFPLDL